jgi:arylsulfatase A-like enzyme
MKGHDRTRGGSPAVEQACVRAFAMALIVAVLAAVACGCSGGGRGEPATAPGDGRVPAAGGGPRYNVVLISIDTLRADHLGLHGYGQPTSPRLDAFARRAVVFTNCLAPSGHTLASHKTMLSGRLASSFLAAHSAALGGSARPTSSALAYYQAALHGWVSPPLSQRLSQAGLFTLGLTDGGFLKPEFGFGEGFDEYRSVRAGIARHRSKAEDWIEGHPDRRFFLFLHGYDVHCPYDPPPAYLHRFEATCTGRLRFEGTCGKGYFNDMVLTPAEKEHVRRHYDAGILHADDEVGKFLDFLDRQGRMADTVIVVTSDHGESLGEREFVGHGELYENQLRVPLLVYVPGVAAGRVAAPVSGADVTPTILDLVTGVVPTDLDGWSLRTLITSAAGSVSDGARPGSGSGAHTGADFEARPRFAAITVNEGRGTLTRLRKIAVIESRYKVIADLESGSAQLFDLERDPQESKDLSHVERDTTARLLDAARKHDPRPLHGFDPTGKTKGEDALTPEMLEELKSLGYVN